MISALVFALFALACAVLAFARHPIFGLYFYLATIYVHPPSRWWGPMLPDLRWALLSALITILAVMMHRGKLAAKPAWYSNGAAVILSIYAVWMVLQGAWALDAETHADGTVKFLKYMIAFWFVYRITDTKETLRDTMIAHVLGCGLLGLLCMVIGREGDRLDGVGGPGLDDANTLGMYLATGLILGLGLALILQGLWRWVLLGILGVIGTGFVLTNTRGAFLGLAAGFLVLLVTKARAHRGLFWSLALVGLVGFAVIIDKKFVERMFTIGDVVQTSEDADASARSRVVIYEAQLRMAMDYPMGAGHRGTATLSPQYLDRRWLTTAGGTDGASAARSSHNTFMTTLVEQGFFGAILYVALICWVLSAIIQVRRFSNKANVDPELGTLGGSIAAALTVVTVAGLATDFLLAEVQFWLFAALVSALQLGETDRKVVPASNGQVDSAVAGPVLNRPVPR